MTDQPLDIAIHGADGQFMAAVEVKNRADLSRDLAIVLRRNMAAHGMVPVVPFFMLVSQDRGFLWVRSNSDDLDIPPSLEFPMKPVLLKYLPRSGFKGRLRGTELEWVVYAWLNELRERKGPPSAEPEKSLAAAGFLDAIRNGSVVRHVA